MYRAGRSCSGVAEAAVKFHAGDEVFRTETAAMGGRL